MGSKRSLGSLLVQVGADTKQLNSALGDAEAKVKGFGSRVKREATGTRASFSGIGNSASSALSRVSSFGLLGGVGAKLGVAAAPVAAAGALAVGAFQTFKSLSSDAHMFSPVSVQRQAELRAERTNLDAQFGQRFAATTSMFNNFGAAVGNARKRAVLDTFENEGQAIALVTSGQSNMLLGKAVEVLGLMLGEMIGLRNDTASLGNETPAAQNANPPMNETPPSGPPMNALANNRGGY